MNIEKFGNTSSASIPLAVCEAMNEERIHPGDHLVLVGFGAGLTWGALVMEWIEPDRVVSTTRKIRRRFLLILARIRSFALRILRKIEGWIWGASIKPK